MADIIISIFISLVFLSLMYVSWRMIVGKLDLEYFYVRGVSPWEINRIRPEDRPMLSRRIGRLNFLFLFLSLFIFHLMILGVINAFLLLTTWFGLTIIFVIVFFIIFESFARRRKKHSS